jgi:cytochrome d ubiquinol oxidase subunit I
MIFGTIVAPIQAFIGDLSAKTVAREQPVKLAAMEGLFRTTVGAPLRILGFADPTTRQTYFAVEIPRLLSFLAYGRFGATVKGLEAFPEKTWPDVTIVHFAFDVMVGTGGLMILLPLWFWVLYLRHGRTVPHSRLMLWTAALTGPLAFIALEAGWMVTELGRQPWIIQGVMLTSNGVTQVPGAGFVLFILFVSLYLVLAATLIGLLIRLSRQGKHVQPAGNGSASGGPGTSITPDTSEMSGSVQ